MMDWTAANMTEIMAAEGDDDLEFAFMDDKELDQAVQTTILVSQKNAGIITTNEARETLGLDKSSEPAADELLITTASGFMPLPGSKLDQQMQEQKTQQQVEVNASRPAPALPAPGGKQPAAGGGKAPKGKEPASKALTLGKAVGDMEPITFRPANRYSNHGEADTKH
jgi:hypothetical protein